MSAHDFGEFLTKKGIAYETTPEGDKTIYKVSSYEILNGAYAGKTVSVGFPIPKDFPTVAPYGIHVKSDGVITENVPSGNNASVLGTEWKFWSRTVNNWNDPEKRTCQYYFDHVNRWLELR